MEKYYRRAKQEEGKQTYNGLKHSQHMFFFRLLEVLAMIAIFVLFGVLIQSRINNMTFHKQAHTDITHMVHKNSAKFSSCDMFHTCNNK